MCFGLRLCQVISESKIVPTIHNKSKIATYEQVMQMMNICSNFHAKEDLYPGQVNSSTYPAEELYAGAPTSSILPSSERDADVPNDVEFSKDDMTVSITPQSVPFCPRTTTAPIITPSTPYLSLYSTEKYLN